MISWVLGLMKRSEEILTCLSLYVSWHYFCNFQYPLFSNLDILIVIWHGVALLWSYLFEVQYASNTSESISLLRLGKFLLWLYWMGLLYIQFVLQLLLPPYEFHFWAFDHVLVFLCVVIIGINFSLYDCLSKLSPQPCPPSLIFFLFLNLVCWLDCP
jgi:hypothetical protein